jgi:hypothetical protein
MRTFGLSPEEVNYSQGTLLKNQSLLMKKSELTDEKIGAY